MSQITGTGNCDSARAIALEAPSRSTKIVSKRPLPILFLIGLAFAGPALAVSAVAPS